MARSRGKKLISVPEDLIRDVAGVSKDKGSSMGKLVEDALKQTLRINQIGYDLKQVGDFFNVMQAQKVLGGVFVPSSVLDYLTETAYATQKEQLLAKWYESGQWNGKYLKEKFENPVEALGNFLKFSRWDLNEVEAKQDANSIKIRCVSTVLSNEGTELLCKFVEGVMTGMGYKTEKIDCMKGMIILESRS
jgi:hypothetical protein